MRVLGLRTPKANPYDLDILSSHVVRSIASDKNVASYQMTYGHHSSIISNIQIFNAHNEHSLGNE